MRWQCCRTGSNKASSLLFVVQNSPIAKRWEGLLAYLVLGYAAAFMTKGVTAAESALKGAQIGFVIYAVRPPPPPPPPLVKYFYALRYFGIHRPAMDSSCQSGPALTLPCH